MKKTIATLLLTVLLLTLKAASASAATGSITVTYGQTEARSILAMVNEFRQSDDAWFWNSDNTTKTTRKNLSKHRRYERDDDDGDRADQRDWPEESHRCEEASHLRAVPVYEGSEHGSDRSAAKGVKKSLHGKHKIVILLERLSFFKKGM